ncbi:MAG: N-acetyltransferase [Verrucomicrobiota bacterium]
MRAALRFAQAERLTVVPACSYVAAYLERHPEFRLSRG